MCLDTILRALVLAGLNWNEETRWFGVWHSNETLTGMCEVLSSIPSPTMEGKVEREVEGIEMEMLGVEMIERGR